MSLYSAISFLQALNKESREKLLGHQHLFYLLQTQPHLCHPTWQDHQVH